MRETPTFSKIFIMAAENNRGENKFYLDLYFTSQKQLELFLSRWAKNYTVPFQQYFNESIARTIAYDHLELDYRFNFLKKFFNLEDIEVLKIKYDPENMDPEKVPGLQRVSVDRNILPDLSSQYINLALHFKTESQALCFWKLWIEKFSRLREIAFKPDSINKNCVLAQNDKDSSLLLKWLSQRVDIVGIPKIICYPVNEITPTAEKNPEQIRLTF